MTRVRRIVLTISVATICILAWSSFDRTDAQTTGTVLDEPWDRISADVTITRHFVKVDNTGEFAAPALRYRWDRARTGSGWKSVLTVVSVDRPMVETLDGPVKLQEISRVARLEDDGDGSPVRVYDHNNQLLHAPTLGDPAVLGELWPNKFRLPNRPTFPRSRPSAAGLRGVEALAFARERQAARKEALREKLGEIVGRVDGKDQYLKRQNDTTLEVLADPEWGVPLETNVVRAGKLVLHTSFTYEPGDHGALVSRRLRAERRSENSVFERSVVEIDFSNVHFEASR
jgi:hypothetical protein